MAIKEKEERIKQKEERRKEYDDRRRECEKKCEQLLVAKDQLLVAKDQLLVAKDQLLVAKDQLVFSLTREVLRARGLFNIRGVLEHVARIIEQETNEQSNTTRTLRNVYNWRKLSSSAKKIVEKIQERHRSFKIEKIGDQLADIYRDASTKIHHFQVHDKIGFHLISFHKLLKFKDIS